MTLGFHPQYKNDDACCGYEQQQHRRQGGKRAPLGVKVDSRWNQRRGAAEGGSVRKAVMQALPAEEGTQQVSAMLARSLRENVDRRRKVEQPPPPHGANPRGYVDLEMPPKGTAEHGRLVHKVQQREKQLWMGKLTLGYRNYRAQVPLEMRDSTNPLHVTTPRATWAISKRQFDLLIRQWRRDLHHWDDDEVTFGSDNSFCPHTSDLSFSSTEGAAGSHSTASDLPPLVPLYSLGGKHTGFDDLTLLPPLDEDDADNTPAPLPVLSAFPEEEEEEEECAGGGGSDEDLLPLPPLPELTPLLPPLLALNPPQGETDDEHLMTALMAWA